MSDDPRLVTDPASYGQATFRRIARHRHGVPQGLIDPPDGYPAHYRRDEAPGLGRWTDESLGSAGGSVATSTPVIYCLSTVPGIHNPQSKAPGSPHPISDLAEAVRCAHRQRRMCGGARMTFVDMKHQCRQQVTVGLERNSPRVVGPSQVVLVSFSPRRLRAAATRSLDSTAAYARLRD